MNPPPGRYRHFKGKYYEVIGCARHSETEEDLVVYRDDQKRLWARPLAMFTEQVRVGDVTLPRFAYVGPGDEPSPAG
jgi:hypothetical protein